MSTKASDLRQALITVAGYVDDVRRLEGALRVLTGGGEASRPAAPARAEPAAPRGKVDRRKLVAIDAEIRQTIAAAIEASSFPRIAKAIGVSPPTLRRLSASGTCHSETLKQISRWAKGRGSEQSPGTTYEDLAEAVAGDRVRLR